MVFFPSLMDLFVYFINHYENRFKNEMGLLGESMEILKGYQKKFLKGLAHGLKPVVFIGQKGLSLSARKV
jgi:hypothetical protein